jgi:hypothetical protein
MMKKFAGLAGVIILFATTMSAQAQDRGNRAPEPSTAVEEKPEEGITGMRRVSGPSLVRFSGGGASHKKCLLF